MEQIMWDCQTMHAGGAPSTFQRRVLADLYGSRDPLRGFAGVSSQPHATAMRRARHAAASRRAPEWPGLAVVSVLAALPLIMSLYAMFADL